MAAASPRVACPPGERVPSPLPASSPLPRAQATAPSAQGETLMAPVRYILNREDYARNNLHRTRLVRAALGNDAGLIGAALLPLFR